MKPPANKAIPRRDVDAKYRRAELRAAWDHAAVAPSNMSTVLMILSSAKKVLPQVPARSMVVLTLTPLHGLMMYSPRVAPVSVMVIIPAATGAAVYICTPLPIEFR